MNYPSTITHYTTLNISRNATQEEIKTAFRKLAIAHHPDKHATQKAKNHHTEIFKTIREAYEWLSNPKLKDRYDRELNAREKFDSLPFWRTDPTRGERATTAWDVGDGGWDSFEEGFNTWSCYTATHQDEHPFQGVYPAPVKVAKWRGKGLTKEEGQWALVVCVAAPWRI